MCISLYHWFFIFYRLGEPEDTGGGGGDDAESLPSPCGSDSVMETCHTSNNVKQSNSTNSKTYLNNILSTTPSIGEHFIEQLYLI